MATGVSRNEAEKVIVVSTTVEEKYLTMGLVELAKEFNLPLDWVLKVIVHSVEAPRATVAKFSIKRTGSESVEKVE